MSTVTYAKNACLAKMPPYLLINGHIYPLVKVGNLLIMSTYLAEPVGSYGFTPNGVYYYNEANAQAVKDLVGPEWSFLSSSLIYPYWEPNRGGFLSTEAGGNNDYGTNFIKTGYMQSGPNADHEFSYSQITNENYAWFIRGVNYETFYCNADGSCSNSTGYSGEWMPVRFARVLT